MATEVFLIWDGMRDQDKSAQLNCGAISGGHIGYLRATLFMDEENLVLRTIFGQNYWNGQVIPFDFKTHEERVLDIIGQYEKGEIIMRNSNRHHILDIVGEVAYKQGMQVVENRMNPEMRKVWIRSLRDFIQLGIEKQEQGRDPKVYIAW